MHPTPLLPSAGVDFDATAGDRQRDARRRRWAQSSPTSFTSSSSSIAWTRRTSVRTRAISASSCVAVAWPGNAAEGHWRHKRSSPAYVYGLAGSRRHRPGWGRRFFRRLLRQNPYGSRGTSSTISLPGWCSWSGSPAGFPRTTSSSAMSSSPRGSTISRSRHERLTRIPRMPSRVVPSARRWQLSLPTWVKGPSGRQLRPGRYRPRGPAYTDDR